MGAIFGRHHRSRVTEEDKALLQLKQQRDQLKQYKQRVNSAITRDEAAIKQLLRQQERKKALLLLKKKKYQAKLLVKADEHLTTVEGLIQDVEFAQVQVKVLDSLKKGNEALKQLNDLMKLEDVEKIMSDAQEAQAYQEASQDLDPEFGRNPSVMENYVNCLDLLPAASSGQRLPSPRGSTRLY
ncbi:unnamed protein product [Schistocephalus solidus]|uniref:Charged multivesicular body protein 6 n=1 Tax=Schistocephalus solidus TaxID=70667 RepID=A0A183T1D2_SCHSO|nr:unnamed protein product [Schistocephalus solidus]